MSARCPQGHDLTVDGNIRKRGGKRSNWRDCKTCYQAEKSRREREQRQARRGLINQKRRLRTRATKLGLRMVQQGSMVTLFDAAGDEVCSATPDHAEAYLAERFVRRRPGPARSAPAAKWADWIDVFIVEQNAARRRPASTRLRIAHLNAFVRAHPDSDPLTVSRADLLAYLGHEKWSPRTATSIRSTFRVFWGLLFELGHRSDDPARTLPQIKVPRSIPRPCPDHVVLDALATARPQVRLALRVAVETGLRRAEIAQMMPSDVAGAPGRFSLHVVGKGGHERSVPIADDLAEELLGVPTRYVFSATDQWGNAGAEHISPERLGVLVADALSGKWTIHSLRHRFATVAYEASRDIRAVQELLGHVSPVTTAIYTRVADESMRAAAAAARLV